jgi:uncharacterized MnhB-related membrane protein
MISDMRFIRADEKKRVFFTSLLLFLFSLFYLLQVNRGVLDDTAFFGGDSWQYQALGVNWSLGHGYNAGGIESFATYKFDKDAGSAVEFAGSYYRKFLAEKTRYNFSRAPGYPVFLAIVYKIFGIHPGVVKIIQILLLAACAMLMPVIGVHYWPRHGFLSGVISAVIFILCSAPDPAVIMTETLITSGLFILVILLILWELKPSSARTLLLATASALNILIKGSNAFVPAFLILYIIVRVRGIAAKIKLPLVFILGFIICILPWSIYATKKSGSFVPVSTQGGILLLDSNNEDSLRTGDWEPAWRKWDAGSQKYLYNRLEGRAPFKKFLIFMEQNKNSILGLLKKKLFQSFVYPLVCLVMGGMFLYYLVTLLFIRFKENSKERIPLFPLIFFANIFLITLVFYGSTRFLMPFMPFFILPAAHLPFRVSELLIIPGRRVTKRQKLLIFGSCIILFLSFELAARFVLLKTPFLNRQTLRSNSWYRLELIKRWQSEKKRLLAQDSYFKYDKLKGWALKPSLKESALTGGVTLYTNSKGIRGKAEYDYTKPAYKTRILALGGSSTFCEGVGDAQSYPYYLEQILPQGEVLNFGVKGYGQDQMLLYLKEEGVRYNPDTVILGFVSGDMPLNMLEFLDYPKPRFNLSHNKLKLKNAPVSSVASVAKQEFYRLKIIDLASILYDDYYERMEKAEKVEKIKKLTAAILDQMVETIRSCRARPVFVYIFSPREIRMMDRGQEVRPESFFLRYCRSRGIACLSTGAYFLEAASKDIRLKDEGYGEAQRNRIIAQAIREYLLEQ